MKSSQVLEALEKQKNPFVDYVLDVLRSDSELLCSVTEAVWNPENKQLLIRIEPINSDLFEEMKESAVDLIREAAQGACFRADCTRVRVEGKPAMLFKLTQKEK